MGEHCESLLEFLVENCNFNHIPASKNLSELNIIVISATTPFSADSPTITTTTTTTTNPTSETTTNPTTTNPTNTNPTISTSMSSLLCHQVLTSFTGNCNVDRMDEYQCNNLEAYLLQTCFTYEEFLYYISYPDYYEYYPQPYITY